MSDTWHDIWRKRRREAHGPASLAELLAIDGFDGFGGIPNTAFLDYMAALIAKLRIMPGESIFDVGCGAGAFLFPWQKRTHRVGGIDYAENLVAIARCAMPDGDFLVCEAIDLPVATKYDIVFSHSVFAYFPSYDYGANVLLAMIQKAKRIVAILDVPDLSKRDLGIRLRKERIGEKKYNKLYSGLDHLYYNKDWFNKIAYGSRVKVTMEGQAIAGYCHNSYRYNIFIEKE